MYKLDHFTEKDRVKIIALIKENSFAPVTGFGENYPVATQILLEVKCTGDKLNIYYIGVYNEKDKSAPCFRNKP